MFNVAAKFGGLASAIISTVTIIGAYVNSKLFMAHIISKIFSFKARCGHDHEGGHAEGGECKHEHKHGHGDHHHGHAEGGHAKGGEGKHEHKHEHHSHANVET